MTFAEADQQERGDAPRNHAILANPKDFAPDVPIAILPTRLMVVAKDFMVVPRSRRQDARRRGWTKARGALRAA